MITLSSPGMEVQDLTSMDAAHSWSQLRGAFLDPEFEAAFHTRFGGRKTAEVSIRQRGFVVSE